MRIAFTNGEKAHMNLALGAADGNRGKAAKIYRKWHPGKTSSPNTMIRLYNNLCGMGGFKRKQRNSLVHDNERLEGVSVLHRCAGYLVIRGRERKENKVFNE